MLGTVDLGGAPEQAVSDGKGQVYVVIQDKANVAVVDAKTMKVTAHYDFGDKGSRCNGLALDVKNHVLFAACGQSGIPAVTPPQPMMVILNADDGKIHHVAAAGRRFRRRGVQSGHHGSVQLARQRHPDDRQGEQSHQLRRGTESPDDDGRQDADIGFEDQPHPDDGRRVRAPPPAPAHASPAGAPPPGRGGRGPARGPMLPDSFSILVVGK